MNETNENLIIECLNSLIIYRLSCNYLFIPKNFERREQRTAMFKKKERIINRIY